MAETPTDIRFTSQVSALPHGVRHANPLMASEHTIIYDSLASVKLIFIQLVLQSHSAIDTLPKNHLSI